ncbi:CshA-type fibril repeat protein, partial [Acinetobacter calcoaceticus]
GTIDPTTVEITKQPSNGTLTVNPETGKVTYTPNDGFSGADEFEYTVKDNDGNPSNPATVVIDVEAPPVAVDDSGRTKQGVGVEINILENDTDVDGTIDPTTVVITEQPKHGTLDINKDTGKVTYTPEPGYSGQDNFKYTVKDNDGNVSNPANVIIDITGMGTVNETVKEVDLPAGPVVATGEIILDNPNDADVGTIVINPPQTELTSGGQPVTWTTTPEGVLVGSTPDGKEVVNVKPGTPVTENGKTTVPYEVELKAPVDHDSSTSDKTLDLDFGITTNVGDSNLVVTVEDDASGSTDTEATVIVAENTFYANVVISLDFSTSMEQRDSGIKDPAQQNGIQKKRYDAALDAIDTMLDKYQEQLDSVAPGKGEVQVNLSGFAEFATQLNLKDQKETWVSLSDAKTIVAGLRDWSLRPEWDLDRGGIGVNTNYDRALQEVVNSYLNPQGNNGPVKVDGAHIDNTFYFISDGEPNYAANPHTGELGIQEGNAKDYKPGNQYSEIGESDWTKFLKEQNMKSIAIGIGPQMGNGEKYLKPIAYDGQKGENPDGTSDVIVLKDMSSLADILSGMVPETTSVKGSISHDADGKQIAHFGADGAGKMILEVDGQSYTYDYATGKITSTSGAEWTDMGNGVLEVKTSIGSSFQLHMSENEFGKYEYKPGAGRPSDVKQEEFKYTLVDKDGDSSSSTLVINVEAIPATGARAMSALKMNSPLDDLDVFNAVDHTIDSFAKTPDAVAPTNSSNISVSQHLEQLSADQSNLI